MMVANDVSASMMHEEWTGGNWWRTFDHLNAPRFHSVDWANGPTDTELNTEGYWGGSGMLHDLDTTLDHVEYARPYAD